jgi:hypothetical protein
MPIMRWERFKAWNFTLGISLSYCTSFGSAPLARPRNATVICAATIWCGSFLQSMLCITHAICQRSDAASCRARLAAVPKRPGSVYGCGRICPACSPHGQGSWTRCRKAAYPPPLPGKGAKRRRGGEGGMENEPIPPITAVLEKHPPHPPYISCLQFSAKHHILVSQFTDYQEFIRYGDHRRTSARYANGSSPSATHTIVFAMG